MENGGYIINTKELEQVIIGAALIDKNSQRLVLQLNENYFRDKTHKAIFNIFKKLESRKEEIDVVTVAHFARSDLEYKDYITDYMLAELASSVSSVNATQFYIEKLDEEHTKNWIFQKGEKFLYKIANTAITTSEILQELRDIIVKSSKTIKKGSIILPENIKERRLDDLAWRRKNERILTYFKDIDRRLSEGFTPGIISAIAGPTNSGKTSVKCCIEINQCRKGMSILSVNPEMGFIGEMDRIQTICTKIPLTDIKRLKDWNNNDPRWIKLKDSIEEIRNWNFYIDSERGIRLNEYFNRIEELKNKIGLLDIVYFDTLEKITDFIETNDTQKYVYLMNSIEEFAEKMKIHVVMLAQFNRNIQHRERKIPEIGDISYNSALEKSCHNIFCTLRDNTFDKEAEDTILHFWIIKQRDGWVGKVDMDWNKEVTTVSNFTKDEEHKTVIIDINDL